MESVFASAVCSTLEIQQQEVLEEEDLQQTLRGPGAKLFTAGIAHRLHMPLGGGGV